MQPPDTNKNATELELYGVFYQGKPSDVVVQT